MKRDTKQWILAGMIGSLSPVGCYSGLVAGVEEAEGTEGGEPGADSSGAGGDDNDDDGSSGGDGSTSLGPQVHRELDAGNLAPEIADPGPQQVDEDTWLDLDVAVRDANDDPLRVWALNLPPGAVWDESERRLRFRPDFIQGGKVWDVTIVADDGEFRSSRTFEIEAVDTIEPPAPEIDEVTDEGSYKRIKLVQETDDYLDSPGYAGRVFEAYVMVPDDATPESPMPVRVSMHGIGAVPATGGASYEFRVAPYDPHNTYWWGYSAALPDGEPDGTDIPDYTQRRVMHLVAWVLENYPEADAGRVYAFGSSMGGAGAMTLGVWYARHFAYVHSLLGQAVPRNHRPSRLAQLEGLWGPSEGAGWDAPDVTRMLADSAEARDQFLFTRHGKDDPTIHFGAAVLPSPLTGDSLYDALQGLRVGHFAVWDEGAHGPADPELGTTWWWAEDFSLLRDDTTFLRRDLAFPAFTLASSDRDPGTGEGNGKQKWSVNAGYAGELAIPGDTGWNGEIAGALNRFLRWDATTVVDTIDRFAVPLRVIDGEGDDPPAPGYPTRGDRFDGELPVVVDVTPRRLQAFRTRPGEVVRWRFGAVEGEATADETGAVTVPGLELGLEWELLELERAR